MAYTIRPLLLGKMLINTSLFTYMLNFNKDIWIPLVSWYIKADEKHVLIDTGAPAEMMRKYWYSDYEEAITFEDALNSLGITPEKVDIVIQTHLHFDHCGNTPKCKNAEVVVQADELAFSRRPHPLFMGSYLRGGVLDSLHFREVEGDAEILPGIWVYKVPGHSPGSQAVSVKTEKGKAVFSGFCAINENFSPPEKLKKVWPVLASGVHTDPLEAFSSAVRVKELGDFVIPTHDMAFAEKEQIP